MSRQKDRDDDSITLDDLIEEIIVDAYGEDERLSAFCQVIEDEVPLPAFQAEMAKRVSGWKDLC